MALKGSLLKTAPYNNYRTDFPEVYFKIEDLEVQAKKRRVRINVRGYATEYARHNQGIGVYKKVFFIPLEEFTVTTFNYDELMISAYKWLEANSDFEGNDSVLSEYTGDVDIKEAVSDKEEDTLEGMLNINGINVSSSHYK